MASKTIKRTFDDNDQQNSPPNTKILKKELICTPSLKSVKKLFPFGNYDRYYGYRNNKNDCDHRVQTFLQNKEIFLNKEILDIGCNEGVVTLKVAELLNPKSILGIDIDSKLIKLSRKNLSMMNNESLSNRTFFRQANYVLKDESLLKMEKPIYDVILCLSVTKWIHLNFGDNGLKFAFRRMYKQLKPGGHLILEAQSWKSYHRRKKLNAQIFENYRNINFFPIDFKKFLLSESVGFKICQQLNTPNLNSKGFGREIEMYSK